MFVQKSPAATIETLADAILDLTHSKAGKEYIGTRHEVFGGFRELFQDYCNKNESAKSTIRLAGAAQWAKWDIKHCSKVLLFSRIAEATFKNRYPTYAEKAYVIPLPFVKEKVPNENSIEKKYFSYIGSTTPAHG